MPMPPKERFLQALVIGAGGTLLAAGGVSVPAASDVQDPQDNNQVVDAAAKIVKDKKPPNGG
jgi:hypothetical protein